MVAQKIHVIVIGEAPEPGRPTWDPTRSEALGPNAPNNPLRTAGAHPPLRAVPVWSAERLKSLADLPRLRRRSDLIEPLGRIFEVEALSNEEALALVERILHEPGVRAAYVRPKFTSPTWTAGAELHSVAARISSDPHRQGHLDPKPDGVNARAAWQLEGGNGTGVSLFLCELGWSCNHVDLQHLHPLIGSSGDPEPRSHGCATLGVLCALDSHPAPVFREDELTPATGAFTGMVPNVTLTISNDPVALLAAAMTAAAAGPTVLLLEREAEVQKENIASFVTAIMGEGPATSDAIAKLEDLASERREPSAHLLPTDLEPELAKSLRSAIGAGVLVVVPAANGGMKPGPDGACVLDPLYEAAWATMPEYEQPIRVAAAKKSGGAWVLTNGTNYHSRIDCLGHGDNLWTCQDGSSTSSSTERPYGATSAAAAVIGGVTAAIAGAGHALGHEVSIGQIKSWYREAGTVVGGSSIGTPVDGTTPARGIPDLQDLLTHHLGVAPPEVYVRDNFGDIGLEPSVGPLSHSPDICFSNTPTPNPQAAFGAGSGTENTMVGSAIVAGTMNYLYVRAANLGGTPARYVLTRIYYAEAATLIHPGAWRYIASCLIDEIPVGGELRVSPEIPWDTSDVDPGGHCFVAELVAGGDLPPPRADVTDMASYVAFVRRNNIAWRNFTVVTPTPLDLGLAAAVMDVRLTGGPGPRQPCTFEILPRLPKGARLELKVETEQEVDFGARWRGPVMSRHSKPHAIAPHGRTRLGPIWLGGKDALPIQLVATLPESAPLGNHGITIIQRWRDILVGGVTMAIGERAKGSRGRHGETG